MDTPTVDELRAIARDQGVDALGVSAVEVFERTRRELHERKADGLHADMQFTYRNPDRATDPARHLPGARSLVVGAKSYLRDSGEPPDDGPVGSVARYVWEDHYAQLEVGLRAVADRLAEAGARTRILIDDNALVDREAAYRAGLGWYGKNANLLLPHRGSWFVLGSVLTDALLPAATPLDDGCGGCTRCLSSCPTNAIVQPGVIDANRCLAWLVQARGVFPVEHREALGLRIYGCDDCQEVCPPNLRSSRQPVEISNAARRPWIPLVELLQCDDEELMSRYGQWYIPDREPRYLRRNALVALANSGATDDESVRTVVEVMLVSSDDLVRAHAVWAARKLGFEESLLVLSDLQPTVVSDELERDVSFSG
ncbi:MAG: tRNA epoxyqueuosine(34) reductase QueG [Acidimicrobiales bacterium]